MQAIHSGQTGGVNQSVLSNYTAIHETDALRQIPVWI